MKGETIRQKLEQVGKTPLELAELLGVSPQTMHKILHTSNVLTGTVERICEVLDLPVSFFYADAPVKLNIGIDEKVRVLLKKQNKRVKGLCEHVGMTYPTLRRMLEHDSCDLSVLVKIADFFGVPVTHFLTEEKQTTVNSDKDLEILYLKGQLKAYETAFGILHPGEKTEQAIQEEALQWACHLGDIDKATG